MFVDWYGANQAAQRLLDKNKIDFPPVDPVKIAESVGLKVIFASFSAEDNNISGFYNPHSNSIVVNSEEFGPRQNFTVAHELGHKIMHEEWAKSSDYSVMYRDPTANNDNKYEKEANRFAACLLVPRRMLDLYWETYSREELAQIFAVSVPMINNRINSEYGG